MLRGPLLWAPWHSTHSEKQLRQNTTASTFCCLSLRLELLWLPVTQNINDEIRWTSAANRHLIEALPTDQNEAYWPMRYITSEEQVDCSDTRNLVLHQH